jgi:hypothetical protein
VINRAGGGAVRVFGVVSSEKSPADERRATPAFSSLHVDEPRSPERFRMSSGRGAHGGRKIGHEPVDRPTSRSQGREPKSPKGNSMLRKVAIALVAASMFAAPVMAQTPAATDTKPVAPSTTTSTDKSAPATTVKANKSKANKHSRLIRNTRTVAHKPVMAVKHARHFNAAKSHKVVIAHKPAKTVKYARHFNAAKSYKIAVAHKPAMTVKHARHFNAGKNHKVAGTANKVAAAKSATRSSAN